MGVVGLRGFIEKEVVIEEEVSTDYEVARILHKNQGKTVFFKNLKNSDFKIAGNVCPSRERLCSALGTDRENYIKKVLDAFDNPVEPVLTEKEHQKYEVESLHELPILRHFERDGGRYITSGIVVAEDPEIGRNVSVHRLMVKDEKTLAARVVERHLYKYIQRAERENRPLEVAIAIGVHPAVFFSAAYPVPEGYDEFKLASSLLGKPLELVKCRTVALAVPCSSEIVIEGKILPGKNASEGPFVDITGTYDIVRKQPVIEVSRIAYREKPVYQALLPSGREHKIFMGMPQEPGIYRAVGRVASVVNVCLTEGGCSWLHGAVSISKKSEEDGKKAIHAALEAHRSMKHVTIVDEDINIFDSKAVEFALATRFQGSRDMVVIKDVKGSSLDPSADENSTTTKIGFDATKYLKRKENFEKVKIRKL